jgi:hypothetical protein
MFEIAEQKGITVQELGSSGDRWFGEHRLFRIWLLAVVINSMYSFYWDVELDWGLALCEVDTWIPKRGQDSANSSSSSTRAMSPIPGSSRRDGVVSRFVRLWTRRDPTLAQHNRSPCPTPNPQNHSLPSRLTAARTLGSPGLLVPEPAPSRLFAFGLRPVLLLPDPLVYHLFALIDLVLRFTWSLKLSSHLHTISEIESGVFMMEALELLRRWMWVFVRIEWEAVKKGELQKWSRREGARNGDVLWTADGEKELEGA